MAEVGDGRVCSRPHQVRYIHHEGLPRDSAVEGEECRKGGCREEAPHVLLFGPEEQEAIL